MDKIRLLSRSLIEHAEALSKKEYCSVELTEAFLERIDQQNARIGAFLTVTHEVALAAARASDQRRRRGESLGLLDGIPCAVKDNLCTKNILTTCGSRMLEGYRPPYDATAVDRLLGAGAVLLGKTNMDEFGMGSTTERSAFSTCRNPLDLNRVPGGSSGGSAAAVAAAQATYSLGSDTGGSVRQPAAFCGLIGMNPTYGRVSRYGLIAYSSSMDQVGVLSRTVADNAAVLHTLCGADRRDATTAFLPTVRPTCATDGDFRTYTVGVCEEILEEEGLLPEIRSAVIAAAERYRQMGVRVIPVSLPSLRAALSAYYVIAMAEASSNLARYDGVRYGRRAPDAQAWQDVYLQSRSQGFGEEVKRRILLGSFVLANENREAYYQRAKQRATEFRQTINEILGACDAILLPTAPSVAYGLGERTDDPIGVYGDDRYTAPVNLGGFPAISLPFGKSKNGLPIGVQLWGGAFSEEILYRLAYALEQAGKEDGRGRTL